MARKASRRPRIVTSSDLIRVKQLVHVLAVQRDMRLSEASDYVMTLLDSAEDVKLYDANYEGLPEVLDSSGNQRSNVLLSLFNSRWWEHELPKNYREWGVDERRAEFLAMEQRDAAVLLGLSSEKWAALILEFPQLLSKSEHGGVPKRNTSSTEQLSLDRDNPHFSVKLAAAIEAWQAVSKNKESVRGKSVKQALVDWLRRNAAKFDLLKDDGSTNEQGIEEIAKIANWDTKGGAPRTPGGKRQ